jgi:hypothetical protein
MGYSIFLTYNPKVTLEQSTALRLQTIANLYGLRVELPDRMGASAVESTQQRISRAAYVVAIALKPIAPAVKEELNYAAQLGKTIIIIYDEHASKTVNFRNNTNVIQTPINFNSPDIEQVLHKVSSFIAEQQTKNTDIKGADNNDADKSLIALLGIALGALALAAIFSKDKK